MKEGAESTRITPSVGATMFACKGSGKCWRSSENTAKSWWPQKSFLNISFTLLFP